jgi:hypothetical protein
MIPMVCLLTKEQIGEYWEQIEWRLDATPELARFYTKEDIVNQLGRDRMQVWTAGSDLVLLTQVIEAPKGKVFQIIWAHGTGIDEHWEELKEKFHIFAWMTECKTLEVLGRPGWLKRFKKENGFKVEYVAYSATVEKPRIH